MVCIARVLQVSFRESEQTTLDEWFGLVAAAGDSEIVYNSIEDYHNSRKH